MFFSPTNIYLIPKISYQGFYKQLYNIIYISAQGVGSEDCLFVSISTTKDMMMNAVKTPGMVWIHGGGWKNGNGQLDRSGFLDNGIVAMTVQVGLKVYLYNNS